MVTADFDYSCCNKENLLAPIQMQLHKKVEIFCVLFIAFLESIFSLEHFQKISSIS